MLDVSATIVATKLSFMGAEPQPVWIVSADEGDACATVVFMGHDASARATRYARSHYQAVNYRMHAEYGQIGAEIAPQSNGASA